MARFVLKIEDSDLARVCRVIEDQRNDGFVIERRRKNLTRKDIAIDIEQFWQNSILCIFSSVQRAGPNSHLVYFMKQSPFPLSLHEFHQAQDKLSLCQRALAQWPGIRFRNRRTEYIIENYNIITDRNFWTTIQSFFESMKGGNRKLVERQCANFISDKLKGFGPKQSRNLLQALGVSRYEVPIDSRILRWFDQNNFIFPFSQSALSDERLYSFILDQIQHICEMIEEYPCILDASIFSTYDNGGWNQNNMIY